MITRRANGSCIATTATFTSRAPGDERVADLAGVIDHAVCAAEMAVIGPSAGREGDRLRSAVLAVLRARGVPLTTATEHAIDVTALWPAVRTVNTGETSALALAHSGAVQLGWPVQAKKPAA